MKKISGISLLILMMALVLTGCSTSAEDVCKSAKEEVIMVTDSGGVHDKSFNQGAWEGVQQFCGDKSVGASYIESKTEADYVPNLTNATQKDGIKVVIAVGENLSSSLYTVAKDNPDMKYILIDGVVVDENGDEQHLDNVKSYLFNEQESGYLVGYIAGEMTKTNKVGFIGGMEITPVQKFGWGFAQGLKDANKDAELYYQYAQTFSDSTKGQQLADQMYNSGVDIIFTAAGGTNDGVLSSAKTKVQSGSEAWVIGVDRDMYEDGIYDGDKSVILTSALKRVDNAVYAGLETIFNDTFDSEVTVLGINEEGVGVPEENPNIEDAKVITKAQDALKANGVESEKGKVETRIKGLKISGTI